jgi:hypothetical protein
MEEYYEEKGIGNGSGGLWIFGDGDQGEYSGMHDIFIWVVPPFGLLCAGLEVTRDIDGSCDAEEIHQIFNLYVVRRVGGRRNWMEGIAWNG